MTDRGVDHGDEGSGGDRESKAGGEIEPSQNEVAVPGDQDRTPDGLADLFPQAEPSAPPMRARAHHVRSGQQRVALRDRVSSAVIGVVVVAVLAVVCVGLIIAVVVKTQNDSATAAREAASYTPPPLSSSSAAASGPVIAIISDQSAIRGASGLDRAQRWPARLAAAVDGEANVIASSGAGYTGSDADTSFVDAAESVPSNADVVLFVGGAEDSSATSIALARAATQAFAAAADQAPQAQIVAVGPLFSPTSGNDLGPLRDALRSAAGVAEVQFVDPIAEGWIPGVDAVSGLTPAIETTVATRMKAVVDAATG